MADRKFVEDPETLNTLQGLIGNPGLIKPSGGSDQIESPVKIIVPAPETPKQTREREAADAIRRQAEIESRRRREPIVKKRTKELEERGKTTSGNWTNRLGAMGRGILDTVTFGTRDEIGATIDSALSDKTYEQSLDEFRAYDDADEKIVGNWRTGGQIAGAMVPFGAAAKGGTSLISQMGRGIRGGVASGFGYGYGSGEGDAAARLENATETGMLAGVGGGLAAPLARGVGALAGLPGAALNHVRGLINPDAEAARRVGVALSEKGTGMSADDFLKAQQVGLDPRIVDLGGESTRALGRWASNASPVGREVLKTAVADRKQNLGPAASDFLNSLFPNSVNVVQEEEVLRAAARTVNKSNYDEAYALGQAIWNPRLSQLASSPTFRSAMKASEKKGADKAAVAGEPQPAIPFTFAEDGSVALRVAKDGSRMIPNLEYWDVVKQELDDQFNMAMRAGERSRAADVDSLRRALVDELDTVVPEYKTARGVSSTFFKAYDAMDAGRSFATQRYNLPEAKQAIAKMNSSERELFARGYAHELSQRLLGPSTQTTINRFFSNPEARARLNLALGDTRANEVETFVRLADLTRRSEQAISGNSTTAQQLMDMGLLGAGVGGSLSGFDPTSIGSGAALSATIAYALRRGTAKGNEDVARRIADMLISNDPEIVQQGIRRVARSPKLMGALRTATGGTMLVGAEKMADSTDLPDPTDLIEE